MTSFKNYITANIQGLVVKALDQFCQGEDRDCRAIHGTPETAFSAAAVGDEYATIPFSANDTPFTMECFAKDGQTSCRLFQRPKPLFAWFFGETSGGGLYACDSRGSPLVDTKVVVNADCNGADGGNYSDASADATSRRGTDTVSVDSGADTSEDGPTQTDAELDAGPDAAVEIAEDATMTQDATEDAFGETDAAAETMTDAGPDAAVDAAVDASGTQDVAEDAPADDADAVSLPNDVSEDATPADASIQDAVAETAPETAAETTSGICQYFCDTGTTDAVDAILPQDATPAADISGPPAGVASKMCTGPAGTELLFAPPNTVAAACTNSSINALIAGAKGCMAECGFYDNNVILSTAPNTPVPFSTMLFAPPEITKQSYSVTLTLHAPVFANGMTPALPGFMESSFVFVYKVGSFKKTGYAQWDALDQDDQGNIKGQVRITYKPDDFVYDVPGFLDTTYTDVQGNEVTYTYPCSQIQNPIINCAEVK